MVLEQILKIKWIERKGYSFFIGIIYSVIGIFSAILIFPDNVGVMSIAFTSLLIMPTLANIIKLEESIEIREKKFSLALLFRDHKEVIKVYTFSFLGIFFTFSIVALLMPQQTIGHYFAAQVESVGISGQAFSAESFTGIILNNILVLLVCFILSIVYGAGSVLFLTWNASVWGVAFAYFLSQSLGKSHNIAFQFIFSLLPFLPHMISETLAYVSASIVGGVVSKAVLKEKLFSKKFHHIMTDAIILLVIAMILIIIGAALEVNFFWL